MADSRLLLERQMASRNFRGLDLLQADERWLWDEEWLETACRFDEYLVRAFLRSEVHGVVRRILLFRPPRMAAGSDLTVPAGATARHYAWRRGVERDAQRCCPQPTRRDCPSSDYLVASYQLPDGENPPNDIVARSEESNHFEKLWAHRLTLHASRITEVIREPAFDRDCLVGLW